MQSKVTSVRRIDAFADAVLADLAARDARQERGRIAAEVGYYSPRAASVAAAAQPSHAVGVAGLVRNLAAGMTAAESWDRYAARQFMGRVHRRLIAWSLEEDVDAARWTALLGARAIVASAIMKLSR